MTERLDKTVAAPTWWVCRSHRRPQSDLSVRAFCRQDAVRHPHRHGLYTASLISAVLGTRLPGPGAVYISQTLNFRAPVKIGDTVEVRVSVAELIRKNPRAAHLHLLRRWRNRARRRGLGKGAVETARSRRPQPLPRRRKARGVPLACGLARAHTKLTGRRREEAARRAIRPFAAPIGAVGRGQRLAVGHDLVDLFLVGRPVARIAGDAFAVSDSADQRISGVAGINRIGRNDPAILGAATPFAGGILKLPLLIQISCANATELIRERTQYDQRAHKSARHRWPP